MDRHNEVLPTCLKHTKIKTGCFCVILHNSSATPARDATYKPRNHDASHPCILLISYRVSLNYYCTQKHPSQIISTSAYLGSTRFKILTCRLDILTGASCAYPQAT